jgi:molecular chaperone HtpG
VDHKFQVNLQGIIDLLSNHLYSGPEVFVRELLQNGVDAISARRLIDESHPGEIQVELVQPAEGGPATLMFTDDGVGLTSDEVHQFLATIGESSKRDGLVRRREEFIGQFGIGLLSCFLVSDSIVLLTRSAKSPDAPTVQWTGRPDGTYSLKETDTPMSPGTQVFLTAREGMEEYFEAERVAELLSHYGRYLPIPVTANLSEDLQEINEVPPWAWEIASEEEARDRLLDWGRKRYRVSFFDAVRLRSTAGDIQGVAFVLPYSPNPASKGRHEVYLKNMLLSEQAESLLPDWAFFVRCVLNAGDLRPTASRESFYDDAALAEARESLGLALRGYLVRLSEYEPARLRNLVRLHRDAIKLLALYDDEFYEMVIDWLPIETSLGQMTLGEVRERTELVRYSYPLEQFRQIASVAASQGLLILNAGYDRDVDLLEKMPTIFPEMTVERVDAAGLVQQFEDLNVKEASKAAGFREAADEVLLPYRCAAEVKRFRPAELPALYGTDEMARFRRNIQQSQEVSDELWGDMLGSLAPETESDLARLCFNYNNPLVRKLITVREPELLQRAVELLYVQSLLLGQHPLSSQELQLLSDGLLGLVRWAIDQQDEAAD